MRWLTPSQWGLMMKAGVAALLASLPFGGPTVVMNPQALPSQSAGQTGAGQAGQTGFGAAQLQPRTPGGPLFFGSGTFGGRRKDDLSDELDLFKELEDAQEGEEKKKDDEDDDDLDDWVATYLQQRRDGTDNNIRSDDIAALLPRQLLSLDNWWQLPVAPTEPEEGPGSNESH